MKNLGELLVNLHIISKEQLETAELLRSLEDVEKTLKEVLLEQGMVDEANLAHAVEIAGALDDGTVVRKAPGAARDTPMPADIPSTAAATSSVAVSTASEGARRVAAPGTEASSTAVVVTARPSTPPRPSLPVENLIIDLLVGARESGASSLHVSAGEVPRVRVNGTLVEFEMTAISPDQCREHLLGLLSDRQYESFWENKSIDFCSELPKVGRARVNLFTHRNGLAGVLRLIPSRVPTCEELGLPPQVKELIQNKRGLVLITGPSGCGKTSTLAALVSLLNETTQDHVITLEDPIEYEIKSQSGFITQREIRTHSKSFAKALHAALREDPDIIVVGELLDAESVSTAITAAEAGHLVLGTCHTRNVPSTILRILDQFPAHKRAQVRTMLAGTLRAVLCQDLVPNPDHSARHLVCELAFVNLAISNLIREDRLWQIPMVMQMNQHLGMQTLDDALDALVRDGKISREEAHARAVEETRFGGMGT